MLNKVTLIGRITRDLELKTSKNGKPFVPFTIAVNGFSRNNEGNDRVDFIPCFAWNRQAENMVKFLHKGSLIGVDGSLTVRRQTNQENNQPTTSSFVTANRVIFLDSRKAGETTKPSGGAELSQHDLQTDYQINPSLQSTNTKQTDTTKTEANADGDSGITFADSDAIIWD